MYADHAHQTITNREKQGDRESSLSIRPGIHFGIVYSERIFYLAGASQNTPTFWGLEITTLRFSRFRMMQDRDRYSSFKNMLHATHKPYLGRDTQNRGG